MKLPSKQIHSMEDLADLQQWFSNVITRPLYNEGLNPYGIVKKSVRDESRDYIQSTKELKHFERMEIYNQQYWYRLLTIMQDEFPILRHLLGIEEFNEVVEAYLVKHPSDSHYLSQLQKHLVSFLKENYSFDEEIYLLDSVKYDLAISTSFEVKQELALNPQELTTEQQENLSNIPLNLQSHVFLFELTHDLKSYREEVIDDNEEEVFPDLKQKENHILIYRINNTIQQEYISKLEYDTLKHFQQNHSINDTLENLSESYPEKEFNQLGEWFSYWVSIGLFKSI